MINIELETMFCQQDPAALNVILTKCTEYHNFISNFTEQFKEIIMSYKHILLPIKQDKNQSQLTTNHFASGNVFNKRFWLKFDTCYSSCPVP